jgi:hypothetical protein
MFIGHYGPSFFAKRVEPALPLWVLVLAAHLMDVFWSSFVILGIEYMAIVPGYTRSNPMDLYYIPFTHSLPAACGWAAAAGLVVRLSGRSARAAVLVSATVIAHWVGDLLVHSPDLPLWDNTDKVGFGLWNNPVLTLVIEGTLAFGGVAALVWANGSQPAGRVRWLPVAAVLIFALQIGTIFMPPPPSPSALAATLLGFYVVWTAVAVWIDRGIRRPGV